MNEATDKDPFTSRTTQRGLLLLLLLSGLLLYLRLPEFFQHPNQEVIEPWGDGYKAYTVIQYHVKYDSTYSHFQGMNYPYGEHVAPAATQPLLSNAIKWFSRTLFDISEYTVGILNFSLLLGLLLCALFLYLIFRRLATPVWYAVPVAILLTFMAPQFARMTAHYGLAHPEVLPAVIYLLMRYYERPGLGRSLWVMAAVFAFSLIHFYYFAILAFTISFFFLFYFLRNPRWRRLPALGLHYAVQIIIPLLVFSWWMNDGVSDRTAFPWGFFNYLGIWEGTFTSMLQPHYQWIDAHLIKIEETQYEGRAYVGLVGVLAAAFLLVSWVRHGFRRAPFRLEGPYNGFLQTLFYASLPVLLFSYGYPFAVPGLEHLLNYTGPLRQFRSVGRFAWLFYYVINIIAFVWLYQWGRTDRRRWALWAAALALLLFEAWHYHRSLDLRLDDIPERQPGRRYTELAGIDYDDYQAILPAPYYNVGSDNFWGDFHGYVNQKSLTLSVQTGLPTTGAMLTRTSLSQTLKQLQLVTEPYRPPAILEDLPDDRPFLLVYDTEGVQKWPGKYDHLTVGARLLHEDGPLRLYELPLSAFAKQRRERRRRIEAAMRDSTLYRPGAFGLSDSTEAFFYENFDTQTAARTYLGSGAYEGPIRQTNLLLDQNLPGQQAGATYVLSFWLYAARDLVGRSELIFTEYDPAADRSVQQLATQVFWQTALFDPNGWVLVEWPVRLFAANTRLQLTLRNPDAPRSDTLWVDEVLVRPQGVDVYRETGAYLWKNNRYWD